MIKAVVFDMDDTLYPEREYLISGFDRIGDYFYKTLAIKNTSQELLRLFDEQKNQVYPRYLKSIDKASDQELLNKMIQLYRENKPQILHFYPDVIATVDWLKSKGIKIGVITDGRIDGQQNKVDALRLNEIADFIVLTDKIGQEQYRKPHPKSFEMMAQELGVEFAEMIYVGDNPIKDFAIAKTLPIITVEIVRNNKIHENNQYYDNILPKYTIKSLCKIKEIVDANE